MPVLHLLKNSSIRTEYFSLTIKQLLRKTCIIMSAKEVLNTKDLPQTYTILKTLLPQVMDSVCFNDTDTPFSIEVRNTEIGHLFEHVLLEYLCQEKLLVGFSEACYQGYTDWNWKKNPRGTFHIVINSGSSEEYLYDNAIKKTISLINTIIESGFVKKSIPDTFFPPQEFLPLEVIEDYPITFLKK